MFEVFFPWLVIHQTDRTMIKKPPQAAGEGVNELPGRVGVPVPNAPGKHAPPRHLSRDRRLIPLSTAGSSEKSEGSSFSPHRQHRHSTREAPRSRPLRSFPTPRGHHPWGSARRGGQKGELAAPEEEEEDVRRGAPSRESPGCIPGCAPGRSPPCSPCTSWLRLRAPPHPRALCAPRRAPPASPMLICIAPPTAHGGLLICMAPPPCCIATGREPAPPPPAPRAARRGAAGGGAGWSPGVAGSGPGGAFTRFPPPMAGEREPRTERGLAALLLETPPVPFQNRSP